MKGRLRFYTRVFQKLGWKGGFVYIAQRIRLSLFNVREYRLWTKNARVPLWIRNGTSDLDVFGQIFLDEEYSRVVPVSGLVLDCGANVGFSAAYFLNRFPDCRLIAIEPDADNCRMIARNLRPHGERYTIMCAAIWSHSTVLSWANSERSKNDEWGRRVAESDGRGGIRAIDIPSLIKNGERVALLKVDIEGAEEAVFSAETSWLSQVDQIAIELHGERCRQVFLQAIRGQDFKLLNSGEYLICHR